MIAAGAMVLPQLDSRFIRVSMPRRAPVSFLLDLEGMAVDCEALAPEWGEDKKQRACKRTLGKKAARSPAKGPDGEPAFGIVRGEMMVSGTRPTSSEPELEFRVVDLPGRVTG